MIALDYVCVDESKSEGNGEIKDNNDDYNDDDGGGVLLVTTMPIWQQIQ